MTQEKENQDVWNESEVLQVIEAFRGKPVTADLLKAFCERHHFKIMVPSQYEDFLFAIEHNERKQKVLGELVKVMLKVQITPEVGSEADKKAVLENNYAIEREVLEILKDSGILFREADLMIDSISSAFVSIFTAVKNRANNMSARQLQLIAQHVLGKPEIVLKELSDWKAPGDTDINETA